MFYLLTYDYPSLSLCGDEGITDQGGCEQDGGTTGRAEGFKVDSRGEGGFAGDE